MILLLATVDTDAVVTNGDNGRGWMRPNNTRGYKNFVSVIIHRNRVQTSSACRNERLFDAVRQSVAGIQRETRLNVRVRSLIYSRSVHNTDGATSKNAQLCRNRWMRMQGGPAMNLVASASKAKKTYLIDRDTRPLTPRYFSMFYSFRHFCRVYAHATERPCNQQLLWPFYRPPGREKLNERMPRRGWSKILKQKRKRTLAVSKTAS